MLILLLIPAAWTWNLFFNSGKLEVVMPLLFGGAIGGFVVALVTIIQFLQCVWPSVFSARDFRVGHT